MRSLRTLGGSRAGGSGALQLRAAARVGARGAGGSAQATQYTCGYARGEEGGRAASASRRCSIARCPASTAQAYASSRPLSRAPRNAPPPPAAFRKRSRLSQSKLVRQKMRAWPGLRARTARPRSRARPAAARRRACAARARLPERPSRQSARWCPGRAAPVRVEQALQHARLEALDGLGPVLGAVALRADRVERVRVVGGHARRRLQPAAVLARVDAHAHVHHRVRHALAALPRPRPLGAQRRRAALGPAIPWYVGGVADRVPACACSPVLREGRARPACRRRPCAPAPALRARARALRSTQMGWWHTRSAMSRTSAECSVAEKSSTCARGRAEARQRRRPPACTSAERPAAACLRPASARAGPPALRRRAPRAPDRRRQRGAGGRAARARRGEPGRAPAGARRLRPPWGTCRTAPGSARGGQCPAGGPPARAALLRPRRGRRPQLRARGAAPAPRAFSEPGSTRAARCGGVPAGAGRRGAHLVQHEVAHAVQRQLAGAHQLRHAPCRAAGPRGVRSPGTEKLPGPAVLRGAPTTRMQHAEQGAGCAV